jgi:hypothetical protein
MFEHTDIRELDCRRGDGIEVQLLWEPSADRVFVAVIEEHTGDFFRIDVDRSDALEAFRHPYAYSSPHARRALASNLGPLLS